MLTGGVPEAVLEILYGAHLCAISKKDGGLRPVAVGNVLRRLVAKCCSNLCRERASSVFAPHQYGFGIPNGCEIVAHSARTYCSLQHDTPKVLCKIDFSNAFNCVRRDVILKRIFTDFSEIFPFVNQCYRNPTLLLFGENVLMSNEGVQQGDPLGPLLFCLAISSLTKQLSSKVNMWYLDDGFLAGDPASVMSDLSIVSSLSKDLGLLMNLSKCEIMTFSCS